MIHNHLIEHTNKAKVYETLLLKADDLSMSRALTIALQVESMAEFTATLTKQQVATSSQAAPIPLLSPLEAARGPLRPADAMDPDSLAVMLLGWQQRFRPSPQ